MEAARRVGWRIDETCACPLPRPTILTLDNGPLAPSCCAVCRRSTPEPMTVEEEWGEAAWTARDLR